MSDLWTQVERIFDLPGEMARFFGVFDSWVDGLAFPEATSRRINIELNSRFGLNLGFCE